MILEKEVIVIFLPLQCSDLNVYSNIYKHDRKLHQNNESYYSPAKMKAKGRIASKSIH